jgi:transcriptional regulator
MLDFVVCICDSALLSETEFCDDCELAVSLEQKVKRAKYTDKIQNQLMFIPKLYKETDLAKIYEFINANSFGILISVPPTTEGGQASLPIGTHIPIELTQLESGEYVLQGHVARANEQGKLFDEGGAQTMAIFHGPHTYVSSSWYDHVNVSTWNYIAVHVYGKIRVMEGEELKASISKLVRKYEAGQAKPELMEELPDDYLEANLKGVIGFQMSMDKVQAQYKLSQNRKPHDHANVINELEKTGDPQSLAIATEMKKNR